MEWDPVLRSQNVQCNTVEKVRGLELAIRKSLPVINWISTHGLHFKLADDEGLQLSQILKYSNTN